MCECYLLGKTNKINEENINEKKYEVVWKIKEKTLNLNSYESIEEQHPIFKDGKCINSIIVDNIYEMYDVAREDSKQMSMELFKKIAKDENYPPPSHIKTITDLKRAIDMRKVKLSERLTDLTIIEKTINHQKKFLRLYMQKFQKNVLKHKKQLMKQKNVYQKVLLLQMKLI